MKDYTVTLSVTMWVKGSDEEAARTEALYLADYEYGGVFAGDCRVTGVECFGDAVSGESERVLVKVRCEVCGFTARDAWTMELWNDGQMACPSCNYARGFDVLWHMSDGSVVRTDGDVDDPTRTEFRGE